MRIYLVGMMGSGKTTIGIELSKYLNYQFIDTDRWIENQHKVSIPTLFEQFGEAYFRMLETETLLQFDKSEDMVIATGGGVVEKSENCAYLASQFTIFLKGSGELLWERVSQDENRPLAANKTLFLERLERRESHYTDVATVIIQIDHKTVKDIVAEILFQIADLKGGVNT